MPTQEKLTNAYKIFMMKHPSYQGYPSLKELDKENLLDNVDLDENDGIEELYSSTEEMLWKSDETLEVEA